MSDIKLGALAPYNAQRDAIHIAVAPVSSDEWLQPGDCVALVAGTTDKVQTRRGAESEILVGVVDPFLHGRVTPGEKFWLLLYPQTITSLRHEWTHPVFDATSNSVQASREWLSRRAHDLGATLEDLIYVTTRSQHPGCFGQDIDGETRIEPELWEHVKRVTGVDVPFDKRPTHFRCAC